MIQRPSPLYQYCTKCGRQWVVEEVTVPQILQAVTKAVHDTGLVNKGFDVGRVGTNHLKTGGAIKMIMNDVLES